MYTVFEVKGKKGGAQWIGFNYIHKTNQLLQIDYQKNAEPGDRIIFNVLSCEKENEEEEEFGHPYLKNMQVIGEVVKKESKGKKTTIFKKKAKKRYEVKGGHRQLFT